jgi:hypothetical protein
MADIKTIYAELAKEIAEEYDIAGIIQRHNSSLSEGSPAYTEPLDNERSFGELQTVAATSKSGYGAMVTVQNKRERDNVLGKIYDALDPEAIRQKFVLKLLENEIMADVEEMSFSRSVKFSEGSKSIFMNVVEMKKDGTPRSSPTSAFVIFAKGLRGTSADPHELMTATLISMNRIVNYAQINRMNVVDRNAALEALSQEVHSNHRNVIGHSSEDAGAIEGDIVNLAKAISVSNYVVGLCRRNGATVERVYQTGAAWHRDLTRRNNSFKGSDPIKDSLIKDYNSADLIVRINHQGTIHHWGLSLKKKSGVDDDPTLLNKPLVGEASDSGKKKAGYLYLRGNVQQKREMASAEENFWKQVYMVKFGPPPSFPKGKKLGDNVTPRNWVNVSNWKKTLNDSLSDNDKNAALTGKEYRGTLYPKNFFFEKLDEVFRDIMSQPDNFREFLDLAFRFDIDEYVNQEHFHFSLITGSGKVNPNGTLTVRPAEDKSSALLKEVFTSLLSGGVRSFNPSRATRAPNLVLETTRGKLQAFQQGATAAKLYYTMKIDTLPVVNLEVRYKGAITSSPQFQVFITVNFKRYLHTIKRRLGKQGIRAFLRR